MLLCNHHTSVLSLDGGVTGQWLLCFLWYEWSCKSDLEVTDCRSTLGHGNQQHRWSWPQFWKCSDGPQLALGKAASCRSQHWFFRMLPSVSAEGPIVSILWSHGEHPCRMNCGKYSCSSQRLALWAEELGGVRLKCSDSVGSVGRVPLVRRWCLHMHQII